MEEKIKQLEEKVEWLYKNRLEEKNEKRYWTRETKRVKNLIRFLNWLEEKHNNFLHKKIYLKKIILRILNRDV